MNKMKLAYTIALICFVLQFVLLGVGTFDRTDIEINSLSQLLTGLLWTLIKGIPWLVLLPGLIMKTGKIMAWMSYVCLVYFIIWMLAAFGETHSNLGTIGVLLTLLQFSASAYYTRLKRG